MDSTLYNYSQALLNKNALINNMKQSFLYLARMLLNHIFLITKYLLLKSNTNLARFPRTNLKLPTKLAAKEHQNDNIVQEMHQEWLINLSFYGNVKNDILDQMSGLFSPRYCQLISHTAAHEGLETHTKHLSPKA